MSARRVPHMAMPNRDGRPTAKTDVPLAERLLLGLGAQPSFAEAVLGDLAEERARRAEQEGVASSGWWYAREAVRSVPHLVWNAVRHGGAGGRARVAMLLAAIALVPTLVIVVSLVRVGPPVRLVVDGQRGGDATDGVVLNTRHPVQLAVRALDAKGRALPSTDVRYRWMSGTPMPISPSGVVTCKRRGDVAVRASVGTLVSTMLLHCRPVHALFADGLMRLVAGEPGRNLVFTALGPDRRPVNQLAGELHVEDSSIATLQGSHVMPVAPGRTAVTVRIGDADATILVDVYEPVRSLDGLRPDQRLVSAPVRLAQGDTIRWRLSKGMFWLTYDPASDEQPMPAFAVDGPIACMPFFGPLDNQSACVVRGPGAWIRITRPRAATGEIAGRLSLTMGGP